MGKDYSVYLGVNKASGGNGKRTGGGSGSGNIRKQAYQKPPEKNARISKEAESRSQQSYRSYKVPNDPPRRPDYDKNTRAEEKPKGKLPLPLPAAGDAGPGGVQYFPTGGPWLTRNTDEADATGPDAKVDYGSTDDSE